MDKTIKELAINSGVREKSIREDYREFRYKLVEAALVHPSAFGGAGFYMLRNGELDGQGKGLAKRIKESELFKKHVDRHAPRLKSLEDYRCLVFEIVIRVFCLAHLEKDALINYSEDTEQAINALRDVAQWIKDNARQEGFLDKHEQFINQFYKVTEDVTRLQVKEGLLIKHLKSPQHRYPSILLYNDLRRHLLKHPL